MSRVRIYARNLLANWVGYGANLLVMFFLSPFVVHTLGDVNYGVWSLMMSLTGYLGLVELGTRNGLGRFINYYLGKDDVKSVNSVISTGMAIFVGIGLLLLVVSLGLAVALPWVFPKIPAAMMPTAKIVVLLVAVNLWFGFIAAPYRQVLRALDRFDWTNGIDLLVLAIRSLGTVWALSFGYGLVALALVQLVSNLVGQGAVQILARIVYRPLRISRSLVSWERFRELFGYTSWAFLGGVADRLVFRTDEIVIAIVLGPKWITYYAIGAILVNRAKDLMAQVTSVFGPRMVQNCGREDWGALQEEFLLGSRLTAAVTTPLLIGLIVFGRRFLDLWMGPAYSSSYSILLILTLGLAAGVPFGTANFVFAGLGRIKTYALMNLAQGLLNLACSLAFATVLGLGIQGVALGTLCTQVPSSLIFGFLATRWIHMPWSRLLQFLTLRWFPLVLLYFCICVLIARLIDGQTWRVFALEVLLASAVYPLLAWFLLLDRAQRAALVRRGRQRKRAPSAGMSLADVPEETEVRS